jgi:hypothetical protein
MTSGHTTGEKYGPIRDPRAVLVANARNRPQLPIPRASGADGHQWSRDVSPAEGYEQPRTRDPPRTSCKLRTAEKAWCDAATRRPDASQKIAEPADPSQSPRFRWVFGAAAASLGSLLRAPRFPGFEQREFQSIAHWTGARSATPLSDEFGTAAAGQRIIKGRPLRPTLDRALLEARRLGRWFRPVFEKSPRMTRRTLAFEVCWAGTAN